MLFIVCDHLLDNAKNQHDFKTMNRQDGQLQFYAKQNNLSIYAHGSCVLNKGVVSRNGWKTKSLVISMGVIQGFWLIESMVFPSTLLHYNHF
jgi:hypothetical protein